MFHTIYILSIMFIIPVICVCMAQARGQNGLAESICKWFIFWTIGVRALTTGAMQFLNPSYTMALLQVGEESKIIIMELGFAQFGIGLIGVISLFHKHYRGASVLSYGAFMIGATMIHISRFTVANFEEVVSLIGDVLVIVIGIIYFFKCIRYEKNK